MEYSKLHYPGNFTCTECHAEMIRRYTNVLTCGDRCRKRRSRRLKAEAAAVAATAKTNKPTRRKRRA